MLDEISRLQEEFASELATIRGRVDTLEADVAELEANQFSTTTKLVGQVSAILVVPFDDADLNDENGLGGDEADATFVYRSRLNFDTSFTGEDRLRIRLQAGDNGGATGATGLANTVEGLTSVAGGDNNLSLNDVYYSFPVGNRISAIVAANSINTSDFVTSTIVPFDGTSVASAGAPEFYGLYEGRDFGAGFNFALTNNLVIDLGYSSEDSNSNTPDDGLFNNNSYIAQLNFLTDGLIDAAVTYIGAGDADDGEADNTIAGLINFDFGRFQVSGHYAATDIADGGDADSYMGGVAVMDLFGVGNELGIYGGISPDEDTDPLLVEAYYHMNLNEFFTLTPAIIYADNDGDEGDNFYGAIRTRINF